MFEKVWELAEVALNNQDIPVGAIIVDKDNNIIGEGYNTREKEQDITGHAEINAIKSVKEKDKLLGAAMYVNLEPCVMCAELIKQAKIKTLYFNIKNDNKNESDIVFTILKELDMKEVEVSNDKKQMFLEFFKALREKK